MSFVPVCTMLNYTMDVAEVVTDHRILKSPDQLSARLWEQAQWSPCDVHAGIASCSLRPPVPTRPGDDSSFCRSTPSHDGQAAVRVVAATFVNKGGVNLRDADDIKADELGDALDVL